MFKVTYKTYNGESFNLKNLSANCVKDRWQELSSKGLSYFSVSKQKNNQHVLFIEYRISPDENNPILELYPVLILDGAEQSCTGKELVHRVYRVLDTF